MTVESVLPVTGHATTLPEAISAEELGGLLSTEAIQKATKRQVRTMPSGSGEFVSRNGRLYAAEVPVTVPRPDPRNTERTIDVPLKGPDGKILMRPNPAAVETIKQRTDGKEDSIPVVQYRDGQTQLNNSIQKVVEVVATQGEAQTQRMDQFMAVVKEQMEAQDRRMAELTQALVSALKK